MAFTYQMEVMVTPFNNFAPATIDYKNSNLDANQSNICYYRWLEATPNPQFDSNNVNRLLGQGALVYNLFDVRLRFSWPVLQNGSVGPGRQTYRTMVAAPLAEAYTNGVYGWFFQPQTFANAYPSGL